MVLPYLDLPVVRDVFANGERARVQDAADRGLPGLFASATAPPNVKCGSFGGYCNAVGVQQIATQVVLWADSVTPYAAYPTILANRTAGLAWYHSMLSMPHMQSVDGSVESSDLKGSAVAPLLTWDAKITTVLAMLGGTGQLLRGYMARDGLLPRFNKLVGGLYQSAFADRLFGTNEAFAMPARDLAPQGPDFPSCRCACSENGRKATTESLRGGGSRSRMNSAVPTQDGARKDSTR